MSGVTDDDGVRQANLQVQSSTTVAGSVTTIGIRGRIDGVMHIGALIAGDGACALHACFGSPVHGQLTRPNVRIEVVGALPQEYGDAAARVHLALRTCLDHDMLQVSVWEVTRQAASFVLQDAAV